MNDGMAHATIGKRLWKRPGQINGQLCEVELAKSEIEQEQPIILAIFSLLYAKYRKYYLYYILFSK